MVDHPAKEAIEISEAQPARRGLETYSFVSAKKQKLIDAEAEAVHIILTGIDNDIYSAVDTCANAKETWLAIERLMQGENINKQDFLLQLQLEWKRSATIFTQGKDLKEVSYHKLFDILKQHQNEVNEIRAERLERNVNPLALVAATQQQPTYYP
ncbi:hypothetical protein Tco_0618715 [Tanacetum coccineum]